MTKSIPNIFLTPLKKQTLYDIISMKCMYKPIPEVVSESYITTLHTAVCKRQHKRIYRNRKHTI